MFTSTQKAAVNKAAGFEKKRVNKAAGFEKKTFALKGTAAIKRTAALRGTVAAKKAPKPKFAAASEAATKISTPLEAARRARARRELGRLDYIRSIRVAVEVLDQATIARELGVSQPSISKLLSGAEARGVKPVPEGFSGAGPYEIAERFAAGDIDRDTMIRELSTWPYAKNEGAAASASEWESTPYMDTPGSFAEVGRAFDEGLIDGDAYDQILDASDEAAEV